MQPSSLAKSAAAFLMLSLAGYFFFQFFSDRGGVSDKAFFYDQSEEKLFVGSRTAVPPIRGLNDDQEDAVRAVVISTNNTPKDKRSWTIAYLEMYTPELKRQFEQAQADGTSPEMGRGAAQQHRLVRRVGDPRWYSLSTAEGEKIVSAWVTAGPNGGPAVVCSP